MSKPKKNSPDDKAPETPETFVTPMGDIARPEPLPDQAPLDVEVPADAADGPANDIPLAHHDAQPAAVTDEEVPADSATVPSPDANRPEKKAEAGKKEDGKK